MQLAGCTKAKRSGNLTSSGKRRLNRLQLSLAVCLGKQGDFTTNGT